MPLTGKNLNTNFWNKIGIKINIIIKLLKTKQMSSEVHDIVTSSNKTTNHDILNHNKTL